MLPPRLRQTSGDGAFEILAGFSSDGTRVLVLEARSADSGWELRASARLNDGGWAKTEWRGVEPRAARLEVEWWQAFDSVQDGRLYVSLGGELTLWLADLENDLVQLDELDILQFEGGPVLRPLAD